MIEMIDYLLMIFLIGLFLSAIILLIELILCSIALHYKWWQNDAFLRIILFLSLLCPILWFDKDYREHYKSFKELLRK